LRTQCEEVIRSVEQENGLKLEIPIGKMIELARACVTADEIGKVADFSPLVPTT